MTYNKTKLSVHDVQWLLLGTAIVLMPINISKGFAFSFGDLGIDASFYPLVGLIMVFMSTMLLGGKFKQPNAFGYKLFLFFIIWIIISVFFNLFNISTSISKGRTGVEKFILQFMVLSFYFLVALVTYNLLIIKGETSLKLIRFYTMIGLLCCGMYCIIEVPALLGSSIAENFLEKISSLFRNETYRMVFFRSGRLRSLSQEPSWFGTYLAFATPWFLSLLLNTGKKIILPVLFFLYLVLLIFYSQSRVAWFIFIIEFVLFFILAMFFGDKKRKKSPFLYILVALLPLVVLGILYKDFFLYKFNYVFKSFGQNASLEALNSNMERIGFQYAAVCMGLDKPIFGVGLGQYGFWWKDFLPNWAIVLIPELLQDAHGTRWPTSHGLIARLFAETGLGVFIFIGVLLASLCRSMQYVRLVSKYAPSQTPLAISLTTCICGVSASLATGDSLRYFYLWLILALAWSLPIERYKKTLVSS